MSTLEKQFGQALQEIAMQELTVETLETRNSDSLDFHDIAVWQIKDALEAAFNAGARAAMEYGGLAVDAVGGDSESLQDQIDRLGIEEVLVFSSKKDALDSLRHLDKPHRVMTDGSVFVAARFKDSNKMEKSGWIRV